MLSDLDGQVGMIANAVVVAAYALSRAKAKSLGVAIPVLLCGLFVLSLSSCAQVMQPQAYIVDTTPYEKEP